MVQSDFGRALAGAERRMERAAVELTRTRRLLDREDMAGAFGSAFAFSAEVEKLALLARVLPAYTGHPKATELTEQMLLDTVPIEMGYARRGWFVLKIPALLPKKGTGSPIYIQQYLYPALRRYFDGKPPALYRSCVLAYRHVYQRDRPERAYRDHDNIEVNMVTDIVTLYLLPDDAPPAVCPLLLQCRRRRGLYGGVCGAYQPVSCVAGGCTGRRFGGEKTI